MEFLNTKELIASLTGKNKGFITRVAKHQEEKYGNIDIFDAIIDGNHVQIGFGDYTISYYIENNKIIDTLGNGQGSKYAKSLDACALELYKKFSN